MTLPNTSHWAFVHILLSIMKLYFILWSIFTLSFLSKININLAVFLKFAFSNFFLMLVALLMMLILLGITLFSSTNGRSES